MNITFETVKRSLSGRINTFRTKNRARCKFLYQHFSSLGPPNKYIFIFGCQRSGTTLLEGIFRHDYRSAVFGEFSDLSIANERTVWKPLPHVQRHFDLCRSSYVVARSLFESNRASEILDSFTCSVAVWLYRDYHAVVDSMKRKWGDKFFDISKGNESDRDGFWRLQQMVKYIRDEALHLTNNNVVIDDIYALYWLKRNEIFFKQNLKSNGKVVCLKYSDLVTYPDECIKLILQKVGLILWHGFKTDAHTNSLNRGFQTNISQVIQVKCDEMLAHLDHYSHIS